MEGESTAHGQGDLRVFAQQAHVGLDKGEIFFLHVGRVSGEPGQHCRVLRYLRRPPPPKHNSSTFTPADLHISHRWVWSFLWPVWELLVACGLGIEQVGQ